MSTREVFYSARARKDLRGLDTSVSRRIEKKISQLAMAGDPLANAKPLKGLFAGLYRYRIGDYRAVFSISENEAVMLLTIYTVQHRKDVYR